MKITFGSQEYDVEFSDQSCFCIECCENLYGNESLDKWKKHRGHVILFKPDIDVDIFCISTIDDEGLPEVDNVITRGNQKFDEIVSEYEIVF